MTRKPLALSISIALTVVALGPATLARAQILAQGPTPLTMEMVETVIAANEEIIEAKYTAEEKRRVAEVMKREWQNPETVSATLGLVEAFPRLMQLPERSRRLAMRAGMLNFLVSGEQLARNGDEMSKIQLAAFQRVHKPLDPSAPLFVRPVAEAYLDAFLFAGEIQSGKPAPKLTPAARQNALVRLAKDYAKMSAPQRKEWTERMAKITGFRIQWPQMDVLEKLLVRQQLGARLTMEEQQFAQQARQMMTSHNLKMLTSELNHMRANQQLIMGSAPYFNHSTQRWEQIGGVVTEYR